MTKGNPANREVCLQICDAEAINSNDDNFDDDPGQDSQGRDLEEQLDESAAQLEELNTTLKAEMSQFASFKRFLANGDPCAAVFEPRPPFTAALIASQAAVTLRGVAGQVGPVCDLDVAGFNAAPACIITETIAAIAEIIDDSISFLDDEITSSTIDTSYACLQAVNGSLGEIDAALIAIMNQVTAVQEQVAENNRLLLTPLGKREGFNQ